ncbi:hypothetical protein ABVT39_014136 [Epinephelus coioides]
MADVAVSRWMRRGGGRRRRPAAAALYDDGTGSPTGGEFELQDPIIRFTLFRRFTRPSSLLGSSKQRAGTGSTVSNDGHLLKNKLYSDFTSSWSVYSCDPEILKNLVTFGVVSRNSGDQAFFNIKQGNGETVGDISLRIRDAFQEWKRAEPNGSAQLANTLRDQMIISLQPGVLKKELQRQVHGTANMTITELLQEAKELKREGWGMECEGLANQVATTPTVDPLSQWKYQTRTELMQLITELGKGLKEEIKNLRQATPLYSRVPSQRRTRSCPRWDDQGQPICLHCGQAGHFRRECPQGQAPQPALNSQPRPL